MQAIEPAQSVIWPPGAEAAPATKRLWIFRAPLRFYGLAFGTRMTVAKLSDGSLWMHSPINLTPEIKQQLDSLGPVAHVVSPNKLHHLYLGPFQQAYPRATLYAPPGLATKRPDLAFDEALDDKSLPIWDDEIGLVIVRGSAVMEEAVFFHRAGRTLILGDLLENFSEDDPLMTRIAARIGGMYGKPGMPRDWRFTFRDRAAARQSIERILDWPFESIILAHGRLVSRDARQAFEKAFSWLL